MGGFVLHQHRILNFGILQHQNLRLARLSQGAKCQDLPIALCLLPVLPVLAICPVSRFSSCLLLLCEDPTRAAVWLFLSCLDLSVAEQTA